MAIDGSGEGMSFFGYIILFVIIVWVFGTMFGGNGFGFGNAATAATFTRSDALEMGFENFKETCQFQKNNIANVATTQYLIGQEGATTRTAVQTQVGQLAEKLDNMNTQNILMQLSDAKAKNAQLEAEISMSNKFNALASQIASQNATTNAQINDIRNNMLVKPQLSGLSTASVPIITPYLYNCYCANGSGSII